MKRSLHGSLLFSFSKNSPGVIFNLNSQFLHAL
nr:MAG TPA: hypothetical protein [Caudoviricetes sp.]